MRQGTPTDRRLRLMYNAIRLMVEEHFNKNEKSKKYVVYEISLSSTATYPQQLSENPHIATTVDAKFIVKLVDVSTERHKSISCIISLYGDKFMINNIYYTDSGKPVEGFTT
jgi:hypothetical protein